MVVVARAGCYVLLELALNELQLITIGTETGIHLGAAVRASSKSHNSEDYTGDSLFLSSKIMRHSY